MKTRIGVIATFLVFATAPFALAQYGREGIHLQDVAFNRGARHSVTVDMRATDIQREAFVYCMSATEAAHKLMGRMPQEGSYWHGTRHGAYDVSAVSGKRDQLQSDLNGMIAAHRQFLQALTQDQDMELGPNLGKLEQLQADLDLEMSQLDGELLVAKPEAFRVSTNVYTIGKTINKWRSEHEKIAKKMGISEP